MLLSIRGNSSYIRAVGATRPQIALKNSSGFSQGDGTLIQREIFEFGSYVLDSEQMLLRRGGILAPLQPRAVETLLVLVRRNGGVVSKQELMEAVWPDSFVEEGNLTQNIFVLRRELGKTAKWIAYVAYPEGTLWRCRVDGSERLQLTVPPMEVTVPTWSPDGGQIAFYVIGGAKQQRLYLIGADGGTPRAATSSDGGEMSAHWSPDGGSILYSDFPFFSATPGKVAVHRLDLKTQKIETLPGSEGYFGPTWSPDGRFATAMALGRQQIMLFDFKTNAWSELAKGSGLPRWSRDSQYLYYLRTGPGSAVMRVRLSDRRVEEVANLRGVRQAGRLAGLDFGLTPEGDPLLLRDVGTQEVYSLKWERH